MSEGLIPPRIIVVILNGRRDGKPTLMKYNRFVDPVRYSTKFTKRFDMRNNGFDTSIAFSRKKQYFVGH